MGQGHQKKKNKKVFWFSLNLKTIGALGSEIIAKRTDGRRASFDFMSS